MGKTVTTPYAWIDPPVTRNPWNLERTPGGSSSGSAAAVACGMCFGAIGTQTGGSITRPASFCGVAGMKPTHDRRRCDDGRLALRPEPRPRRPDRPHGRRPATHVRRDASRLEQPDRQRAAIRSDLRAARRDSAGSAASSTAGPSRPCDPRSTKRSGPSQPQGAEIVDLDDPVDFEQILNDHRRVMAAEAAAVHSDWLDEFPDDYPPRIRDTDPGRPIARRRSSICSAKDRMDSASRPIMRALLDAGSSTP